MESLKNVRRVVCLMRTFFSLLGNASYSKYLCLIFNLITLKVMAREKYDFFSHHVRCRESNPDRLLDPGSHRCPFMTLSLYPVIECLQCTTSICRAFTYGSDAVQWTACLWYHGVKKIHDLGGTDEWHWESNPGHPNSRQTTGICFQEHKGKLCDFDFGAVASCVSGRPKLIALAKRRGPMTSSLALRELNPRVR
ncbi:hypothetical protein IW262DRAFT_217074 [Armillaria fumosa]|nr:hypothetical protein IW262DRAFT_217074 [Armillaria fumosa]